MIKAMNLNDWLGVAVASQKKVQTVHFDRLDICRSVQLAGIELVRQAQTVIASVQLFLRGITDEHGVKFVIVFLPLGISDEVSFWRPELWEKVDYDNEPPALYLLRDTEIFDDESEEYRCPVEVPVEGLISTRAVFRSFRNEEAMKNGWEFTSGIYLVTAVDY